MVTVALAGNPNCGKTTLFNALTGSRHHVGNWPGVTVERRSGEFLQDGLEIEVVDLPGTYSLAAKSEDERITAQYLASPEPDLILNVLDASNLERNLYLSTLLLELGKPLAFALNMADDAARLGMTLDIPTLATLLGGPVVRTVGSRGEGVEELKSVLAALAQGQELRRPIHVGYGEDIEGELRKLEGDIRRDEQLVRRIPPRWLAIQLLEGSAQAAALVAESHAQTAVQAQAEASRAFLERHLGDDCPTLLAERRYGFAHGLVKEVLRAPKVVPRGATDRLDSVLTHRWLGIPIFVLVMVAVYSLTFVLGKYPQDWIALGFSWIHDRLGALLPPGEVASLVVDGIIPGVGAVVVFVPVIMLLMGCIAFLEDTGYMARAAFIMDRLMHLMGLHGKSFIPLVMGTGCNVPAVQATRTIESRSDRFITILVAPLVSCSARLQVYILIAGTFFRPLAAALAVLAMHFLGFALAMLAGRILRSTLFRGPEAPFVMELPPYRLPVLKSTLIHMWEKGSVFLSRAGTTILAGATLIWFLSHYPGIGNRAWAQELRTQEADILAQKLPPRQEMAALESAQLRHQSRIVNSSLAARAGQRIQPLLSPILDPDHSRPEAWKDVVALSAGFVAKEIVVSTMAVIHQAPAGGSAPGEGLSPLQRALRDQSGLTPLTALAFMVFTLIYTPCLGTVSMMRKELGSWGWSLFGVAYGLGLAWVMAWITVLAGRVLGFS
ncbi:MAG: ferrous iron transport protein B [Acidobacteria bacterium]|nr:ferrous iron transport protein B [Acidobacteriota bacterium]